MASVAVVLNAQAGGTEKGEIAAQLREAFAARQAAADIITRPAGADLVKAIRDRWDGATPIVAAGGDGTINAVANVLAGTSTPLGVVPLGTLNHFAKDLGIPSDLDRAVDVVAEGLTARVDVGEVNDRLFVNNSSIGIYPSLVHAREELQRRGHRKWPALVVAALRVLRTQQDLLVQVEAARETATWRTPFLMVGNNAYDVTGLRIAGRSRLDRGRLFAYVAPRVRVRELPLTLVREWLGRSLGLSGSAAGAFQIVSGTELRIDTRGPRAIEVALDGEVVMLDLPLHYRSRPHALSVFVPRR